MITVLEELGKALNIALEVEVDYDFTPGEKMIRHLPDGGGYPGSPAELAITNVKVLTFTNDKYEFKRANNLGWFEVLDKLILRKYEELLLERAENELYHLSAERGYEDYRYED